MADVPASAPVAAAPAAPAAPAAAPVAAAPAAGAPAAPAPPAQPPAAPAPDSLFGAAPPPPAAAPAPDGVPDWLPEKYRVMADGKLDLAASSQKMAEGYAAAQRRIGTGDIPPETPDAYKDSPVPEAFKDVPLDPGLTKSFRERAHKAGLTQGQLDFVMGEYFELVPSLFDAQAALSATEARAELSKVWSDPAQLQGNMTAAERAVAQMPPQLQEQIREKYGTDPVFWQFAAVFGKEAREDTPPRGGSTSTVTDVQALERSEAYRNPKHPDHEKVSAQVRQAYEKRVGTAPAI
jgi:hypothetical protein